MSTKKTLTNAEVRRIIEAVDKRSLKIRRGEIVPRVKRIADKGETAFTIHIIYDTTND